MAGRRGYHGISDPQTRFDGLRPAVAQLQALRHSQSSLIPAGAALEHAIVSIRMAANLLTRQNEFYGLGSQEIADRYARSAAEMSELRSALDELNAMARTYHPATPESRSLDHACLALRMAADTLTGQTDFFKVVSSDGSSARR